MQKHLNNNGKEYGLLKALGYFKDKKYYKYTCKCMCGNTTQPNAHAVLNGATISCGCYWEYSVRNNERTKPRSDIKHGRESSAANYVWHTYKRNAKKRGMVFLLNKDEFLEIITGKCQYCGCNPTQASKYWGKKNSPKFIYNGIDRVDNNLGYTIENCASCCNTCNKAKGSMDLEQFKKWIDNLINFNIRGRE